MEDDRQLATGLHRRDGILRLAASASSSKLSSGTLAEVLTAFGATAVTFMMLMYALEHRHRRFVLAFAAGCLASSAYGFLAGTWPFGVVELLWSTIALRRYLRGADEPRRIHSR
jgi:hypothetical protein